MGKNALQFERIQAVVRDRNSILLTGAKPSPTDEIGMDAPSAHHTNTGVPLQPQTNICRLAHDERVGFVKQFDFCREIIGQR